MRSGRKRWHAQSADAVRHMQGQCGVPEEPGTADLGRFGLKRREDRSLQRLPSSSSFLLASKSPHAAPFPGMRRVLLLLLRRTVLAPRGTLHSSPSGKLTQLTVYAGRQHVRSSCSSIGASP